MAMIPLERDVIYPESDGRPMGESDLHRDEMWDLVYVLQRYYAGSPDVYVTGNLFFYYRQGDPRSVICPDVCVVKGVSKHRRRIYKLWEEGQSPSFVIEVTSESTRREDLEDKKLRYAQLGVDEYFLHDPYGEYLRPRLQGLRLQGGRYLPIEPASDGSLLSQVTGLTLRVEGHLLRLVETATGTPLLFAQEAVESEQAARLEAEARLRQVEEQLARLRFQQADPNSDR
ncbi:MAG TPA: Uma2 family endonuclease [Thermoanaerobaculia bacterium]|nr:Uma2 family endonuclease [Thermoanaerobaculia bacterium]